MSVAADHFTPNHQFNKITQNDKTTDIISLLLDKLKVSQVTG